jgi:hemolysin activation/secretion protein
MPSAANVPLSAVAIERDFRLLAEDPAIRTINAQLRPGAAPGEASLSLAVLPERRADLYLSAGNSRAPSVGGERIAVGGLIRNLASGGDLLSGEAGLTEGVADGSIAYATPFFGRSTTLLLRGSINRAAVIDQALAPLDIRTRERGAEIALSRRLFAAPLSPIGEGRWSPARSLSIGLGAGWRRQRSFLLGQPFSFAPGSENGRAEYVAARLLGDYVQRSIDQVFAVSLTGTIGIDGTRSDIAGVPTPDRHFLAAIAQLNYARRLTPAGLELRARLTGQYSDGVLFSGERLSIGGERSVRGYRESLVIADRGLVGGVELARPLNLSGAPPGSRRFDWGAFTIAMFAEAGAGWNADGFNPRPRWLGSVGPALAWQPNEGLSVRVAWGIALNEAEVTGLRDWQDDGLHVRVVVRPFRW